MFRFSCNSSQVLGLCQLLPKIWGQYMATIACNAQEIFELNETKEYTLTCTYLLETVLTDQNLCAHSAKLWQILFNKSRFNEELDVCVSYKQLSSILNKSVRTIQRYVNNLVTMGYLIVGNNFRENGRQSFNTFFVRFPKESIVQAKNRKNRIIPTVDKTQETGNIHVAISNKEVIHNPHDIVDRGEGDNIGSPIDIIDQANTINKNNLVVSIDQIVDEKREDYEAANHIDDEIHRYEVSLTKAKIELDLITKTWLTEKDHNLKYSLGLKVGKIEGEMLHFQDRIKSLKLKKEQCSTHNKQQTKLMDDMNYIQDKAGKRVISSFCFQRLAKGLEMLGYNGKAKNFLINEIVFEARFGSLVKCNKSKLENSLEKSVNIALKLVKEGRWSRPVNMLNQILSL